MEEAKPVITSDGFNLGVLSTNVKYGIRDLPSRIYSSNYFTNQTIFEPGMAQGFFSELCSLMYNNGGVGLASNQVTRIPPSYKFFIMDANWGGDIKNARPTICIDPEMTFNTEQIPVHANEGCLSCPGVQVPVPRVEEVSLTYSRLNGESVTETFVGFEARVVQHEMDHLSGKLIIDYLSRIKRDIYVRKLNKLKKTAKRIAEHMYYAQNIRIVK